MSNSNEVSISSKELGPVLAVRCSVCHCQSSSSEEAPVCSGCEERREASARCEDCQELLCADCEAAHKRVRLTRDHRIFQLQLQAGMPAFCPIHGSQAGAGLAQAIRDYELKSAEIEESIRAADHNIATLHSDGESLLQELDRVKDNLIRSIANRGRDLAAKVSQVSSEKKKTLENRLSGLNRTLAQTNTAINLLSDLSTSSVDAEKMMLMKEVMASQVKRLEQSNTSIGQSLQYKPELQLRQWRGEALDRTLTTVMRMVMADLVLVTGDQHQQSQSDHSSPHRQEESDRTEDEKQFHGWTYNEARQAEYGAKKLASVREKLEKVDKLKPIGTGFPKV